MSEVEDIENTEFDELLEHVDLDELDVVKSHSCGWYVKWVGDGTFTRYGRCGQLCLGMDLVSSPILFSFLFSNEGKKQK